MNTNSFSRKKILDKVNTISGKLATKNINNLAKECGYFKRKSGKISPKNFIIGFMLMFSKQRNTYSDLAIEVGLLEKKTITKQSINGRMNCQTEMFIKKVVEQQMREKIKSIQTKKTKGVLRNFNNVMIDDSTTLSLPDELADIFPGNVSKGKKKSQAKIHAMYNMTKNDFPFLNVHSFSNNDQSLSADVLPYLQKGDLCIRDLGFLVLGTLEKFIEKGIYFISRKIYRTKIFDIKTGMEIDLIKELRKNKFIDREVLIGTKQQLRMRLVAIAIPPAQANERRRKARTNRDKRINHSEEYYELLGYSIYITNISQEQCNAETISELYKLRWSIEIIFKSWKSCFSLEKLFHHQCKNPIRVKCIIYLMLLYIYLFHVVWWRHWQNKIENEQTQSELSILKMANFFQKHFAQILRQNSDENLIQQIKTHCKYDKRKDRENAKQFQNKLAA